MALVIVGLFLLLVLTCPVAAENDTSAPTLADGERYNVTGIQVTVADDTDVDEGSIDAADFSLSDGDVSSVRVNESESNATVVLFLAERLQTDDVRVSATDGNVTDAAGNELVNGTVTVTGMDSYVPTVMEFDVERINATDGRIAMSVTEPLATIRLEIRGPSNASLNESHFHAVDDSGYGTTYATAYHFPENGEYRAELRSVTDRAGLAVNYSRSATFVRDAVEPTVAIDGPDHLDTGDRARFDGSRSADNVGLAGYNWTVDGNVTGNGTVFEYAFAEPGTHDVSLTVTDSRGNAETTNRSVVVHEALGKHGVTVDRANDSRVNATVGTNRSTRRVRIADAYGRLVSDGDVTLRSVTVVLPTNETLALGVSGNGTAPSFSSATGETALAVFDVEHWNRSVENPRFRFAVPASSLSRAGVAYSDVGLYRDDGNWTELETGIVRATKSTVVYEARSPGLSTFVVGASGGASLASGGAGTSDAAIRVTDATLATESVAFGEYAVVEATLANEGTRRGTHVTGLTVGSDVRDTRPVTVSAGESQTVRFAVRALGNGTVAVNGTIAGDLTVTGANAPSDRRTATGSGGEPDGNETGGGDGVGLGDVPIPNPLALWPDGLVGAVLTGVVGVTVGTYSVLKALAIYLGY